MSLRRFQNRPFHRRWDFLPDLNNGSYLDESGASGEVGLSRNTIGRKYDNFVRREPEIRLSTSPTGKFSSTPH
jgi:hypothetical protein